MQEVWVHELEQLVKAIPEVFDDNPIQEADREAAIARFRDAIACRWRAVRNTASTAHQNEFENLCASTNEVIKNLMTTHGQELVFAPVPEIPFRLPDSDAEGKHQRTSTESHAAASSRSTASSTKASVTPHVYRFLTTSEGTWTCLKASWTYIDESEWRSGELKDTWSKGVGWVGRRFKRGD